MDDDTILVENISWTKWDEMGRSQRSSKSHLHVRGASHTLCGSHIPEEGNGIEIDTSFDDGVCRKCQKRANKETDKGTNFRIID